MNYALSSPPGGITDSCPRHQGLVDSRPLYYSDEPDGRVGNWMDGAAPWRTCRTLWDENHHLAKVRVAGSNPVFRSIGAGQGWFFHHRSHRQSIGFTDRRKRAQLSSDHFDARTVGLGRCLLVDPEPRADLQRFFEIWRVRARHRTTIEPSTTLFGLPA
jgi:hypothetical protein